MSSIWKSAEENRLMATKDKEKEEVVVVANEWFDFEEIRVMAYSENHWITHYEKEIFMVCEFYFHEL